MRLSCCLCVSPNVARQRLGKHIPAAMHTHDNGRTVGSGVFYVVHVVSDTVYVMKGK
jgi:hypothetical protein